MKPKRTILCVDGNEQALSIRKILLETRGYRVKCSTCAEDAMDAIRHSAVDLVITEAMLPGRSGAQFLQDVKRAAPFIPTLLLSSHAKFLEHCGSADAMLTKGSQSPAELLAQVRTLLVRKRGPKRMLPVAMLAAAQASSGKATL
jgi:DNA-binding response OmpR family regulator